MRERLQQLLEKVDGMSVRERALLLVVAGTVLYVAWQALLLDPLLAERKALIERKASAQQEITRLNREIEETIARHKRDPDAPNRERLAALEQRLESVEATIAEEVAELISPRQMARVLEDVLTRVGDGGGLRLISMENLPAEPLLPPAADADGGEAVEGGMGKAEQASAGIYRHRLRMVFEGRFDGTVGYLQALEALPWGLFWDQLRLELVEYPAARVTVEVHTLSLEPGWLGT